MNVFNMTYEHTFILMSFIFVGHLLICQQNTPMPIPFTIMLCMYLQKVTKSYAFELEGIPAESDYLEVRYAVSNTWCKELEISFAVNLFPSQNKSCRKILSIISWCFQNCG